MTGMIALQSVMAGMLVLASAVYATWRLMTPPGRLRLMRRIAAVAPQLAGRWLRRVQSSVASGAETGCQSCSAAAKHHVSRR